MAETVLTPEEEARKKLLADQQNGTDSSAVVGGVQPEQAGNLVGAITPQPTTPQQPQPAPTPVNMTPTVPPPPPPPPPAPDMGVTPGDVGTFATDWMQNYNPYATDLTKATRAESEGRLTKAEQDAQRNISEWAAGRGLIGSSYEGDANVQLQGELQRARSADELALLDRLAGAESAGRSAAGGFGLETVKAGDVLGLDRYKALLDSLQLGEAQRQFNTTTGFTQQDIDLRAQQLQQEAALQGRTLDLQEARDQATQQLQQEQLAQQGQQFTQSLNQRESEFARTQGLNEQQFAEQQRQFTMQYGEQQAARLQQNDQFKAALDSQNARDAVDANLRSRALDLQQQGMTMDDAYRQAALDQENDLKTRAMDLQEKGMSQDDAYRYAVLDQDSTFRKRALDLQEQGMNLDEAYRQAELEQRQSEFSQELAFRMSQAKTEDDRFKLIYDLMRQELGQDTTVGGLGGTQNDPLGSGGGTSGGTGGGNPIDPDAVKRFLDWINQHSGTSQN